MCVCVCACVCVMKKNLILGLIFVIMKKKNLLSDSTCLVKILDFFDEHVLPFHFCCCFIPSDKNELVGIHLSNNTYYMCKIMQLKMEKNKV